MVHLVQELGKPQASGQWSPVGPNVLGVFAEPPPPTHTHTQHCTLPAFTLQKWKREIRGILACAEQVSSIPIPDALAVFEQYPFHLTNHLPDPENTVNASLSVVFVSLGVD